MEKTYLIYKHTAPNGKAYIGQTCDIAKRNSHHKTGSSCRLFAKAIAKYGWDSFSHEILAEGLTLEQANIKEAEMIAMHMTRSPHGYNLKEGGLNSSHAEETKIRISRSHTGKIVPREVGRKISATKKAQPDHVKEAIKEKLRAANIGKKASDEARAKMSAAKTGVKKSPESVRKTAAAHKGKVVSQETRDKQSAARKGRPAHNKGVPMSESQKLKIRDAKKDPSQEVREKISKASKIAWEKRRESGSAKQSPEHIAKRIAARLATLERKRKEKEAAQGDLYFEP